MYLKYNNKHIVKASALWADAFYKSICLCVCPFVCLFVCVFTFEVTFKRLFAPDSQCQMSKIFRDFESFVKTNGNKWIMVRIMLEVLKLFNKKLNKITLIFEPIMHFLQGPQM